MDIDIDELKKKAMYASLDLGPNKFIFDPDNGRWIGRDDAELEFIHAANPQAVLTLIVKIESMQRENVELKSELEEAKRLLEQSHAAMNVFYGSGWHYSDDETKQIEKARDDLAEYFTATRQQKG